MHESNDDLQRLQGLMDRSSERAGTHLRSVFRARAAMTAADVVDRLRGVFLLHLATVSSQQQPIVAPIDGLFLKGRVLFSAPDESVGIRHLRRRPQVSAAYAEEDRVCIIVHGRAVEVEPTDVVVRSYLEEVYDAAQLAAASRPGLTAFIEPGFMVAYRAR
jgi:uncharacterized pyridoxamine 5'-phosphate oxidase family protein